MKKELMNLFMFLGICILAYWLFRNLHFQEGMTDTSSSSSSPSKNGIAGNAASYSASIKAENIKLLDSFLITKYRSDYEAAILNLDDYLNSLMLKTALSMDKNNPEPSFAKLAEMNQVKTALNSVMKFVDKQ